MLKIREDFNLKELEKFGYEKWNAVYRKSVRNYKVDDTGTFYETIVIYKDSRIIASWLYNDLCNVTWQTTMLLKNHYIQDLVEAGIVEMVKE